MGAAGEDRRRTGRKAPAGKLAQEAPAITPERERGPLAVMLYGFDAVQAEAVRSAVSSAVGSPVGLVSASGMESRTVREVIDARVADRFEPGGERFLMFLEFSPPEVRAAIECFPLERGVPRPIFCVLTRTNLEWTVERLLSDLLEERKAFETRFARDARGRGTPLRKGPAA